ncbi:MAG TPA: F0F1 ATP synthase subunit B [Prolixibacteraceae bacterium]|mgnify:CR=1 FL=1|nr:F0F1 ATP synthase subunit B [Prolixibacteraceae bacterium]
MFLLPHLGTIIWVSIIFFLVYLILSKFAWKPLLKAIENREQSVEKALTSAADAEKKVKNLKAEQEAIVQAARQEKEQIVKEGIDQRDKIVAAARDKAQLEANKIMEEARRRILQEREAALTEMKNQIASLSIDIATKVVHADLEDRKRHEKLVEELIRDVELN